jgi:hypothetical protein
VVLESDYPYTAEDGTCSFDQKGGRVAAYTVNRVPRNDPDQLKAAIAQVPTTVAVDADSDF